MKSGDRRVIHIHTKATGTIIEQIISGGVWWVTVQWDNGTQHRTLWKFIKLLNEGTSDV